jgi:hypothetical protein
MVRNIKKGKKGLPSKFDASLKRKIVEELYSGTVTRGELVKKYQLAGHGTVLWFERWYEKEQKQMLPFLSMEPNKEQEGTDTFPQQPRGVGGLEEELRLARLKIICLETMIDVAEQALSIDIRKKAGAKPSGE